MGAAFTVTPGSLEAVGEFLGGSIEEIQQLKTLTNNECVALGGPEIEGPVAEFCADWSKVMDVLADAINALAEGLIKSGMAYMNVEVHNDIARRNAIAAANCQPQTHGPEAIGAYAPGTNGN